MNKILLAASAALCLSTSAGADANWGSNSFSHKPRDASSPAPVVSPLTGYPDGALSTVDTTPGALSRSAMNKEAMKEKREAWRDSTSYRSQLISDRRHYPVYGDDIAVLRGLQLELALNELHHMNQRQIALAKMAESKAKSASVLNLAHQIRADHEAMEVKVVAMAKDRDIELESFDLATHEKVIRRRLLRLNAADFENAYLRVIQRHHEVAAAELRVMGNEIDDAEFVTLIDDSLPAMQAHKNNAQFRGRASLEDGDLGE